MYLTYNFTIHGLAEAYVLTHKICSFFNADQHTDYTWSIQKIMRLFLQKMHKI